MNWRFAESKLIHHERRFRNFTLWISLFLAVLQHQEVLNGGCCVKLAYVARLKAYKAKSLLRVLMLWPTGAFCPHDSTVLRDTARILMWFAWSFCKKSCEADLLYCNQPGAWACSGWHLLQTSLWPPREQGLALGTEHGAVWYTCSFFI